MKKTVLIIKLFLVITLLNSCSNDDDNIILSLDDFSGKYRLNYVNASTTCTNSNSNNSSTSSVNDLEISSNGRFKRKIYSLNSNNECPVSNILQRQITVTGSFLGSPYGFVEYDNSEIIDDIHIRESVNGIHYRLSIEPENLIGVQYDYYRSN
jgi:hypothetical protein